MSTLYVYLYYPDPEGAGLWHPLGPIFTFVGSLFCFTATWSLGRYYGVLPICRGVRTDRSYRFVRHPIYVSYILMDIGIVLNSPSTGNIAVFLAGTVLYLIRIHYEEDVMDGLNEYRAYRDTVEFRLVPGLY